MTIRKTVLVGLFGLMLVSTLVYVNATVPAPDPATIVTKDETLPTMVAVSSDMCPVCLAMKPVIERVTKKCDGHGMRVQKVDFDNPSNEQLVEIYDVESLPTFLFLDENGVEATRLEGLQSDGEIRDALSLIRGKECPV